MEFERAQERKFSPGNVVGNIWPDSKVATGQFDFQLNHEEKEVEMGYQVV